MLDIQWGFYPDKELKRRYNDYLKVYDNKEFIELFKIKKTPDTYEEYKSDYSSRIQKTKFWLGVKFIVFLFVLFLFIYPTPRTLRLNRKHRVIYLQNWKGHSIVPVPDKGDPLSGILYDRFSIYMFGGKGDCSLFFKLDLDEGEATDGGLLGCYPLPNKNHNMHLIKAMRAYFTEENPEFMQYIHAWYRIPWFNPLIAFCNSFAFIRFPVFRRKKAEQAILTFKQEWDKLSYKQKMQKFARVIQRQKELNERLLAQGLHNEVNNDWDEKETSPALKNIKEII
ncbi:hypothetical protein [Rodentibacter sp. Ppn85]|uniref:hypothetical protein n=1 Tax=Rodentibacter sp. Ppn85 TaxID=1908525 RepID=UPI001E29CB6F|nr:hypothetical protein [Rodentibacter sp. Ppn85]